MSREIERISSVDHDEEISEKEIFKKLKEIIEKDKTEYPNSSLFSMIIDSVESKRNIFKVNTDIAEGIFQEDFLLLE